MTRSLFLATSILFFFSAIALAQTPTTRPVGTVTIGEQQFPVQFNTLDEGKTYYIGDIEGGQTFETAEGTVHLTGALDTDPSIAYGIAVVDLGLPSIFGFLFATPIVPTASPNVVNASLVGGLTDFTGDGVTLAPSGGPLVQTSSVGFPSTGMGVDVGAAVSGGPGPSGSFYTYGPFAAGPIAGPGPGPWTFLTVSSTFSLTGSGDIAALTGTAIIVIPEPATAATTAALLTGTLLTPRRRPRR